MLDPCHSRSSSVESAERTGTSGTIGALFSDEEQGATGYAESCMGAPPIIEDPAVTNIFSNDTRDNRKGVGIIRRRVKEKKSTKLKSRATRGLGRDEDTAGVAAGAPKNSGGIRICGNGGHLSLVTSKSANRSPTLAAIDNNRYQSKLRQSWARSLTSGRGDGRTIHSCKDKKHSRKKDDSKKGRHVEERHHGKVTEYAATSSPQEFSPPLLLSPTLIHNCTVRTNEEPMQAVAADVLSIKKTDQGDSGTMPKYKQDCNSALAATGDGKYCTSKPRQDMKGTVNSRGREIDKIDDERRTSTSVKNTTPEVTVTWEKEAPLGETTQSAVAGYVFVDPSTPVREFRYAEAVQTGYGSAGQQPWGQPRRPHPLCPVHSPQSDRGQIPLSARYSSPPQRVPTPAPWTWIQEQPPLQYGEPVYSSSGTAPVPDYRFHGGQFLGTAWCPAQQPSTVGWDGGANPGYICSGGFATNPHPQYAGPSAAIPAQLPLYQGNAYQGNVPFHQMSPQPYGQQGDANFIPAQFAQTLIQQPPILGVGPNVPPSSWTSDWVQISGAQNNPEISPKWGRTVTESFDNVPMSQNIARRSGPKQEMFVWSCKRVKPHLRRSSRSCTDIRTRTRRASMSGRPEPRRTSSAIVHREIKDLRARRRDSLSGQRDARRRSSINVQEATKTSCARRRSSDICWRSAKKSRESFSNESSCSEPPHVNSTHERAPGSHPTGESAKQCAEHAEHHCFCPTCTRSNLNQATRASSINSACCCCQETASIPVCCHRKCHGERSCGASCMPRVATSLHECHAHCANLATQPNNNDINAVHAEVPRTCEMAAHASCSHSPVTVPVEIRISHQCSSLPAMYPVMVPSFVSMAPVSGVPSQQQAFAQKESDEDVYLLLQSKSGQDVLYKARQISPVRRLPSIPCGRDIAVTQPHAGAQVMRRASAEVGTWESEAHNAEATNTKMVDSRRGSRRRTRGISISDYASFYSPPQEPMQGGAETNRDKYILGPDVPQHVRTSRKGSIKSTRAAEQPVKAPQNVSRASSRRASSASALQAELGTQPEKRHTKGGEELSFFRGHQQSSLRRGSDITEKGGVFASAQQSLVDAGDVGKWSDKTNRLESRSSRKPSLASGRRFPDMTELSGTKMLTHTLEPRAASKRTSVVAELTMKSAGQVEAESPINPREPTETLGYQGRQVAALEPSPRDSPSKEADAVAEKMATVSAEHVSPLDSHEATKEDSKLTPVGEPLGRTKGENNEDGISHSGFQLTMSPPTDIIRRERVTVEKRQWCTDINLAFFTSIVSVAWIVIIFIITRTDNRTKHTEVPPRAPALSWHTINYTVPIELPQRTESAATAELPPEISLCSSRLCVQEGHRLREHMDRESSPCDNFYRYVCKIRPGSPAQQLGGGKFASVDARLEESIASSLRDYILNERHRDVALVRALYSTCLLPTGNSLTALQQEVFSKLPMKRWPYKGSTLPSSNIWQMAGTLVRRFGVVSILEVSLGIKPSTARPTIELSYPRYLHVDDYSLGGVDTLKDAVLEATRELGSSADADNLVSQVMSVATTLAALASNATVRQVLFTRYEDLAVNIRTFTQSLFEGELRKDVVVALREPRLLTEQLQALIATANVTAFINYLGFRIVVYFAALSNSNRVVSLRSVLSSEASGRVIPPQKKWILCLQLVDRVQPACVGHALAMQQAAAGTSATTRLWLARLEDQFYRNLPSVAWMTGRSLKMLGDKLESLPILNAVDAPSWNMCAVRPLSSLDEGSTLRMFVHAAGEYQRERLRQINKASRPLDPGCVFDMQSRYSDSLQAVRVPLGLVNCTAVAEGELLAFQAARTAVRFYMGLLPVTYEHWDSNLQDAESPWALSISSRRSLDKLLECLASDYRTQSSSSFSPWVPVVREVAEDRYPLLAQTTALALAYAAFKELLHDDHHHRVDVRLQSLSDVSSDQLFFVYYALDNCEYADETYQETQYRTRGLLPAEHRVNSPLRHLPQFARAFRCSDPDATSTVGRQRPPVMGALKRPRCDVMRWNSTLTSGTMKWYRRLAQARAKSFGSRKGSSMTADGAGGRRPWLSFPGRSWLIAGRDVLLQEAGAREHIT